MRARRPDRHRLLSAEERAATVALADDLERQIARHGHDHVPPAAGCCLDEQLRNVMRDLDADRTGRGPAGRRSRRRRRRRTPRP